jgi:hypothetical protein
MVDLFVRVAIGVFVGGLLGAGLAWGTTVPAWGVGAAAGALSAVIGSWALASLRSSEDKPARPDSPSQPSI